MLIPVPTNQKDIYKAYIACLNPLLKLRAREIEVLDVLTRTYFSLNTATKQGKLPKKEIYNRMHGDAGRTIMRGDIHMSRESFNNHITKLKKKRILGENGELPKFLTDLESPLAKKEPLKVQYVIEIDPNNGIIKTTSK